MQPLQAACDFKDGVVFNNLINLNKIMKNIRVAVIQVESKPGLIKENLEHATAMIEKVAKKGAKLVVLPELFSSGYIITKEVWNYAETLNGLTVNWLKQTSRRLKVYLGAGFVETDGKDFYNSFILTNPKGEIAGKVRKSNAEAYVFKRGKGSHIINTEIGKIGVGICADNVYSSLPKLMNRESVDLMLMPHASPTPYKTSRFLSKTDCKKVNEKITKLAPLYARTLGIPVIFVNQVGPMKKLPGIIGKLVTPNTFKFRGMSRIIDSNGTVKSELKHDEGIILANVTLNSSKKRFTKPKEYGGMLLPGSMIFRKIIIPIDIIIGKIYYNLNKLRKNK